MLFCPICRDLRTCAAQTVESVGHVYYLPLGRVDRLHMELSCTTCRSIMPRTPGTVTEHKERPDDPHAALAHLLPDEAAPLRDRVALESLIRAVPPDQRRVLLAEPIMTLNYEFELSMGRGRHQSAAALLQLLLIICAITTLCFWVGWSDRKSTSLLVGALISSAGTIGALLLMLWHRFTAHRRLAARLIPRVAESLQPFAPTQEEIAATLQALVVRGFNVARSIDQQALQRAIELPPSQRLAA